jgi:hypothetical protein
MGGLEKKLKAFGRFKICLQADGGGVAAIEDIHDDLV